MDFAQRDTPHFLVASGSGQGRVLQGELCGAGRGLGWAACIRHVAGVSAGNKKPPHAD